MWQVSTWLVCTGQTSAAQPAGSGKDLWPALVGRDCHGLAAPAVEMTVSQASDLSCSAPCPLAYHGPDPEPVWACSLSPCGARVSSSHRSLCFRLLPFDFPQGFCLSACSHFSWKA